MYIGESLRAFAIAVLVFIAGCEAAVFSILAPVETM